MNVPEGYVLMPICPTKELLDAMLIYDFGEAFEVAKEAQKRGENVPPNHEYEMAYATYIRLIETARKS